MRHTLDLKPHLEFPSWFSDFSRFLYFIYSYIFHVCRNKFEQRFTTSKRRPNQLHQKTEDCYIIRWKVLRHPGSWILLVQFILRRFPGNQVTRCHVHGHHSGLSERLISHLYLFSPCLRGRLCFYILLCVYFHRWTLGPTLWASRMSLPCICVYVCCWIRFGECWSLAKLVWLYASVAFTQNYRLYRLCRRSGKNHGLSPAETRSIWSWRKRLGPDLWCHVVSPPFCPGRSSILWELGTWHVRLFRLNIAFSNETLALPPTHGDSLRFRAWVALVVTRPRHDRQSYWE